MFHVRMLFVLMDFTDGCNISAPPAGGGMVSSLLLKNFALGEGMVVERSLKLIFFVGYLPVCSRIQKEC